MGNTSLSDPRSVSCWRSSRIDLCEVGTASTVCPASVGHDRKGRQPHWVRIHCEAAQPTLPHASQLTTIHPRLQHRRMDSSLLEWRLFWWSPLLCVTLCSTFGTRKLRGRSLRGVVLRRYLSSKSTPSPMEWACRRSHWGLVWLHYHERWARGQGRLVCHRQFADIEKSRVNCKIRSCLSGKTVMVRYSQLSFPVNLILSKYGKSITSTIYQKIKNGELQKGLTQEASGLPSSGYWSPPLSSWETDVVKTLPSTRSKRSLRRWNYYWRTISKPWQKN